MLKLPGIVLLMVAPRFFPNPGPQQLDTPLSNADLVTPMADVPAVKVLQDGGRSTDDPRSVAREFSKDVFGDKLPLDVRIAMMGFVRFRGGFGDIADAFSQEIWKKPLARLNPKDMRGDQALLMAYLLASDTGATQKSLRFFDEAKKKMPESFAVAMLSAAARAQIRLRGDIQNPAPTFCAAWRIMEAPLKDKALKTDVRFGMVEQMYDAVTGYRESCPNQGRPLPKRLRGRLRSPRR